MTSPKNLNGIMLVAPNGAPLCWADTKSHLVALYALMKRRTARTPEELKREYELMLKDGWRLKQCSIDVRYDGEAKVKKLKPLPNRPISFRPERADGRDPSENEP